MKNFLVSAAAFAIVVFAAVSCDDKDANSTEVDRVEQVRTSTLQKIEVTRQVTLSTTLQGYETVNVSPAVQGHIEHIYVEVGDRVRPGDNLLRMDQMQVKTARLQFANLSTEMERMEQLRASGAISAQAYDQAKLSYDSAKENLDFLESNTYVKAGIDAVVSAKNYEDGELYAGQPVVTLTQVSYLKALIPIPESYIPIVKVGQKVTLTTDIYPDEEFPASVEIVYPTVDPASHTFNCKVKIANPKGKLRPGMYVGTSMEMGKSSAIVVPYGAVLKLLGSNERYVFVNDGGVAKRIFVKLGQRFDEQVEIICDELKEGDELVTTGQAKLVEGVKLNVVK